MLPPKCTVVGFDGSAGARHALAHAKAWAKASGGTIVLVQAVPAPYELGVPTSELGSAVSMAGAAGEITIVRERARLDAAVKALAGEQIAAKGIAAFGSPAATLLEFADLERADLVVVGPNRSGLRRAILGSVAETVAREAAAPVLVVRGSEPGLKRPILVGVDGSAHAKHAFRTACAIGAAFGARVLAAHVLPAFLESRSRRDDATAAVRAAKRDQDRFLASVVKGTGARALALDGEPAAALLAAAREEGAGLLVLARRGRSAIDRMLLGSVVTRVLRRTTLPLLVTARV